MTCSVLALLGLRCLLRPVGVAGAGPERTGMLGAEASFPDSQQLGVLVTGRGRVSSFPGPAGEVGAGIERGGVFGAEEVFPTLRQLGVLVAG